MNLYVRIVYCRMGKLPVHSVCRCVCVDRHKCEGISPVLFELLLCLWCRAMQPPHETHYALVTDSTGALGVNEVQAARVYHVNSVLELRTQACPTAVTAYTCAMLILLAQICCRVHSAALVVIA